jgi:site-specific DNA recombinase
LKEIEMLISNSGLRYSTQTNKNQIIIVKAAIYARVSSPNQKNNYSINEQITQCRNFIKQRRWITKYIFFDEESGSTINRPKFQLMLEKAKQGCFDVIIFWKLDRFCRSLVDLVNIERLLRSYGIALSSVTEYVDTTTSVGRFNFRSIGSVAELERELIGERARLGLHALAKEHKWPNNHPPLGYDKERNGKLVVNKEEAGLVLKIFKMYTKEKSMPQVAFNLNSNGIKTKLNKKWNSRAIHDILINKLYLGKYNVAGVCKQINEYQIIPKELFEQIQEIRLRYRMGKAKRPPMCGIRRNRQIDKIFNQFLSNLHDFQRHRKLTTSQKIKIVKSEKKLFKFLSKGWNLIKIEEDVFTIAKKQNRRTVEAKISS